MFGGRGPEDLRILLEEALADFGVRRELTVGGTAYYANGKPFAAARGNRLYLRLRRAEEDELRTEAASGGGATPQRDSLGLFPLPASVYDDFERVWTLVVGSFEQTLPPVEEEACGQVLA